VVLLLLLLLVRLLLLLLLTWAGAAALLAALWVVPAGGAVLGLAAVVLLVLTRAGCGMLCTCCCQGWGIRWQLWVVELARVCKGTPACAQVEAALRLPRPEREAPAVGKHSRTVLWVQELAALALSDPLQTTRHTRTARQQENGFVTCRMHWLLTAFIVTGHA